ncbi:AAA family ATPase [Mycolicibacterium psychrotolerans]|uniref:AAA family ATPase n=1 Tax=Mycolicibacterium psychrotolerans TaxID=216929 RepID=UPI003D67E4AC
MTATAPKATPATHAAGDPASGESGSEPEDSPPHTFQATPEIVEAVNAALVLRRPLLLTGRPGSGKSSLVESVADELQLGKVLRWHVTSRSTLNDAIYRYDALGRLHAENLQGTQTAIEDFLTLGPLGTALLPRSYPRALLIDEIDKSDIDLPNDLLNVFERGEFEIPELTRVNQPVVRIREDGSDTRVDITNGRIRCQEFPFVVLTSNGERDFPSAFLRRCIRLRMPDPSAEMLERIVSAHLGTEATEAAENFIADFAERAQANKDQAIDQLMNAIYLVTHNVSPDLESRARITELVLKPLTTDTP